MIEAEADQIAHSLLRRKCDAPLPAIHGMPTHMWKCRQTIKADEKSYQNHGRGNGWGNEKKEIEKKDNLLFGKCSVTAAAAIHNLPGANS